MVEHDNPGFRECKEESRSPGEKSISNHGGEDAPDIWKEPYENVAVLPGDRTDVLCPVDRNTRSAVRMIATNGFRLTEHSELAGSWLPRIQLPAPLRGGSVIPERCNPLRKSPLVSAISRM